MLKGISPLLSPELLLTLYQMGHGDEIVLADAHFPGHSLGVSRVLRVDGIGIAALLDAILPLFELDSYAVPIAMMAVVPGDTADPSVEEDYLSVIRRYSPSLLRPEKLERQAFYLRARSAFCIVMTGETRKYGNIILKKGVTPLKESLPQG